MNRDILLLPLILYLGTCVLKVNEVVHFSPANGDPIRIQFESMKRPLTEIPLCRGPILISATFVTHCRGQINFWAYSGAGPPRYQAGVPEYLELSGAKSTAVARPDEFGSFETLKFVTREKGNKIPSDLYRRCRNDIKWIQERTFIFHSNRYECR